MIGPTDAEMRVLGSLIEKQRTTPDQYPLTLNSLRLACNQSTNREPVVEFDEATVRQALGELGRRRWIRGASGHTSRSPKYRHLFDTEMGLADDQISVLAVLMLRGEQTPGQLKQRAERMFAFHDLDALQTTLDALASRELIERLPRRPGQKEDRYRQRVGGSHLDDEQSTTEPGATAPEGSTLPERSIAPARSSMGVGGTMGVGDTMGVGGTMGVGDTGRPVDEVSGPGRIEALEEQVAGLAREVDELRAGLAGLREQLGE